ncbi:hypothetical protein ACFQMM_07015 [Saliphagus sp. GCM10025308]
MTGYIAAMKTMTDYALRDVDSEVVTRDGEPTEIAYVTTDELTRSSDDLSFLQDDDTDSGETELASTEHELIVDAESTETLTFDVADDLHTLSVHAHAPYGLVDVVLRDPNRNEVCSYRPSTFNGDRHHHIPPMVVKEPAGGEWTLDVESLMTEEATELHAHVGTLQSEADNPDPRDALGFEQQEYEVTPLAFFDDFEAENELLTTIALTPEEVVEAGVDADHLVVVHDDRGDDPEGYAAAIDDFVESGGNLVVTDTGLHLLADLETAPGVGEGDIVDETFGVSHLEEKDEEHPLLTDTRPIQRMTWKVAPLGYPYANDAPMTLLDADAFETSGGTVAGTTDDLVSGGSIFTDSEEWRGIHAIGGLFPRPVSRNCTPSG